MPTTKRERISPPRHGRRIVLLRPEAGAAWLDLQRPGSDAGPALPAGRLDVETVFSSTA